MLSFLQKQFLPLGLVTVAAVGFFFPAPGIYMAGLPTQYVAVSIIFLLSGLMLKTDEGHAALEAEILAMRQKMESTERAMQSLEAMRAKLASQLEGAVSEILALKCARA